MSINVALMGAGGKMGCRITDNLKDDPNYKVAYVEVSPAGIERLAERNVSVTAQEAALATAEIVILAVPDALIGKICREIVPGLNPGTMVIGLDPAAGYAEVLPERADITYFITHPCHPPLFNHEQDYEAHIDWFGGIAAQQNIVCALHQGPEEDYAKGEAIAKAMYAPVMRSHRITTEQMAILEPALVETLSATCISIMREALDEAIAMGVPEEAARDFMLGHVRIELAILFGFAGFPFSDGAKLAIEQAKPKIFQPDWKENVMALPRIKESVRNITHATQK